MSGRSVVHVEIPSTDREAAANFYEALFDWDYRHDTEPVPYTTVHMGNARAGLTEPREGFQPGNILIYQELRS